MDDREHTIIGAPGNDFEESKKTSFQNGPSVFKYIKKGSASSLAWRDMCFSVKAKGARKEILKNISGQLHPGALTCVIGPSGSGKTTLLNVLSGRVAPGGRFDSQITGAVTMNGTPVQTWSEQHLFGYVMQEDSLYDTETPREILTFSSTLKNSGLDANETTPLVDDMIKSLGLEECADTLAGSATIKGLSGGQKKRTSIGAELITNPTITFLDEPTSGLDTAGAYKVVLVLKELTKAQQSVMCTVHQPSSEIFELFDSAIFLARGTVIYQGPPSGIRSHFFNLGRQCPADYNPADFVMFTIEMSNDEVLASLASGWVKVSDKEWVAPTASDFHLPPPPAGKGFCVELRLLCGRQFRNMVRDKATLVGRFGITVFLNVFFSLIFLGAGDYDADDYELQTHAGALTMVAINAMFGSVQPAILTFPSERPVFLREHASQMYGVVAYFLSKTVVEFVLLIVQMFIVVVVDYWAMGFHGNFFTLVFALFFVGAASSSIGLLFGCSIRDIKTAIEVTPLAFVPQILFAGFFIKMEQIPVFLRWLQYASGLKWGVNIVLVNEFANSNVTGAAFLLEANDAEEDMVGVYYAVLIAIIVSVRCLSMVRLRAASKTLYS
jgi:ABC-type multidrug transport system ATPase subunit/ABC-type multidrug transport system permease subunit